MKLDNAMEWQDDIDCLDFSLLDCYSENNDNFWDMVSELVNFCESTSPLSGGQSSEIESILARGAEAKNFSQAADKGTNNVEDETKNSLQSSLMSACNEDLARNVVEESNEQQIITGSQKGLEMADHHPALNNLALTNTVLEPPLPIRQLKPASDISNDNPMPLTFAPSIAELPDVAFFKDKKGRVKRPKSAFIVWAQIHRPILRKANLEVKAKEISVLLREEWSKMTEELKQPYYDEAERLKRKHAEEFPDYKYCPNIKRRKTSSNRTPAASACSMPQSLPSYSGTLPQPIQPKGGLYTILIPLKTFPLQTAGLTTASSGMLIIPLSSQGGYPHQGIQGITYNAIFPGLIQNMLNDTNGLR